MISCISQLHLAKRSDIVRLEGSRDYLNTFRPLLDKGKILRCYLIESFILSIKEIQVELSTHDG